MVSGDCLSTHNYEAQFILGKGVNIGHVERNSWNMRSYVYIADGIRHYGTQNDIEVISVDSIKDTYLLLRSLRGVLIQHFVQEVIEMLYGTPSSELAYVEMTEEISGRWHAVDKWKYEYDNDDLAY